MIENRSTNCGKNAELALEVVRAAGLNPRSVILIQEAAMQRRTQECFLQEWKAIETDFIGFALSIPRFRAHGGTLICDHPQELQPQVFDYQLQLGLGEIPRLRDDESGYGPTVQAISDRSISRKRLNPHSYACSVHTPQKYGNHSLRKKEAPWNFQSIRYPCNYGTVLTDEVASRSGA